VAAQTGKEEARLEDDLRRHRWENEHLRTAFNEELHCAVQQAKYDAASQWEHRHEVLLKQMRKTEAAPSVKQGESEHALAKLLESDAIGPVLAEHLRKARESEISVEEAGEYLHTVFLSWRIVCRNTQRTISELRTIFTRWKILSHTKRNQARKPALPATQLRKLVTAVQSKKIVPPAAGRSNAQVDFKKKNEHFRVKD